MNIQETPIMKKIDKNECVINQLKNYNNINKKLIGDQKLSRNRLIVLMMHYKEKTQNDYNFFSLRNIASKLLNNMLYENNRK